MTPKQVGDYLVGAKSAFSVAMTLERAISAALEAHGQDRYSAAVDAERLAPSVGRYLQSLPASDLPFDVVDGRRLVGKGRPRLGDSPEILAIRRRLELVDQMRSATYELGADQFEHLVAAILLDAGATSAIVTARADEGGIDVYGRMPVRVADAHVPAGLISSVLIEKAMLVLVQAKCYKPDTSIGRPEIDKFSGQVGACLGKYEGNPHPPTRRVPDSAYTKGESALKLIVTSASFSGDARDAALGYDIQLVDGRRIAELLLYRGRGVIDVDGEQRVSSEALDTWVTGGPSKGSH